MKYFPHFLLAVFIPFSIYLGIDPVDRATWWAENIPVWAVVFGLVATYHKFKFSSWAYFFMAFWIFWHTVGGHYTFAKVPFDLVNEFFGWERNMFDRFGHFMIGFFAYPIMEFIVRKKMSKSMFFLFLFSLFSIVTLAAFYELFEWQYAVMFGGDQAADFLGSQGDIWDAQKDILSDTLGALFVLIFYWGFGAELKKSKWKFWK